MKYPFNISKKELKDYLFELKEVCIIEHEDNWFKEKTHTKLYPNLEDAKAKVGRPHYWILNAIDEYEESDNQEEAMIALAVLVFKSNYYSQKLVSSDENLEAKKDLIIYLSNLGIEIDKICECISSMDAPAYARVELDTKDLSKFVKQFI